MKALSTVLAWLLIGVTFLPVSTLAQGASPPLKPEEIDQLVAPVALHPDKLLAQILMASTYPLEVVQAARFVKDNPTLQGDQLNEALRQYTWDDSVKSLVFFPQVLTMMNDKLDWLQKLGDAFLAQQPDVMASVQRLRARAQAGGQLKSTPEQTVIVEPAAMVQTPPPAATAPPAGAPPAGGPPPAVPPPTVQTLPAPPTVIRIEQANPQVVYVPSYDPTVVYGSFPPAYPPYYPYPPGYFAAGVFTFAAGAAVGAALWGDCDWGHGGDVTINNSQVNNFTQRVNNADTARNRVEHYDRGSGAAGQGRGQWQHNPEHRKGVQYRDTATQQRFNRTGPANAQSREAFRGRTQGGDFGRAPQQGALGQQPSAGIGDRRAQPSPRPEGLGQGGFQQGGGVQGRQPGAFEGVGGGRDAQSFSARGNTSRQSFNRSSGGGAGGARAGGGGGGGGRAGGGGGRGGGRR